MNFDSLQHVQIATIRRQSEASRYARGFQAPLRSAFRVWLPSWRFSPVATGPTLFHVGSARGIRPSELSPPPGWRHVSAPPHPRAVPSVGSHAARGGGPARQTAASGLSPPDRSPSRRGGRLTRRAAGMLPWAFLFQGDRVQSRAGRPLPPLTRFAHGPRPNRLPAPQSLSNPHLATTGRAASAVRP
jgi:hypothetical protein